MDFSAFLNIFRLFSYFFQPPPTTRNSAAQMTTRTNTARAGNGTGNTIGKATPTLTVKKELSPYKPLPIPPTFDLDLDSQELKEAINKLGYDPQGQISTSLLARPRAILGSYSALFYKGMPRLANWVFPEIQRRNFYFRTSFGPFLRLLSTFYFIYTIKCAQKAE